MGADAAMTGETKLEVGVDAGKGDKSLHALAMSCDPICRALSGLGGSLSERK